MSCTKIGSLTTEQLQTSEEINGIKLLRITNMGYEIIDGRTLTERVTQPIKGKNVIYCFGATHFVVTIKYYNKLINKV